MFWKLNTLAVRFLRKDINAATILQATLFINITDMTIFYGEIRNSITFITFEIEESSEVF